MLRRVGQQKIILGTLYMNLENDKTKRQANGSVTTSRYKATEVVYCLRYYIMQVV
jgi:hypothetical protein